MKLLLTNGLLLKGHMVKEDDPIVEVATDKVDSEVPAPPAKGTMVSIIAKEGISNQSR